MSGAASASSRQLTTTTEQEGEGADPPAPRCSIVHVPQAPGRRQVPPVQHRLVLVDQPAAAYRLLHPPCLGLGSLLSADLISQCMSAVRSPRSRARTTKSTESFLPMQDQE